MTVEPQLSVVGSKPTGHAPPPPRPLGPHGQKLWAGVHAEYSIVDAGGVELLAQICAACDRAEGLADRIRQDGEIITTHTGLRAHPGIREEIACRAFVARNLIKLGLNVEAIKPMGRPPGVGTGWRP